MREPLISMSDIPQGGTVTVDLYGREVLVMLLNGKPRAYANVCLHHGGPLSLEGDTFVCEWHGSTFEARTGHAISGAGSAGRETDDAPHPRRGRRPDLRLRRVIRRSTVRP